MLSSGKPVNLEAVWTSSGGSYLDFGRDTVGVDLSLLR